MKAKSVLQSTSVVDSLTGNSAAKKRVGCRALMNGALRSNRFCERVVGRGVLSPRKKAAGTASSSRRADPDLAWRS